MTVIKNAQFDNIMQQLQTSLNQFGGSSFKGGSYINCIFDMGGDIGEIATGSTEQKANGVQSLIKDALSFIMSIVDAQGDAKRKVEADEKEVKDVEEDSEKIKAELNASMESIGANINGQTQIVTNAKNTIADTQAKLQEKQQKIEETIKLIQAEQEKLIKLENDPDPTKKEAILNKINELSGSIINELTDMQTYQNTVSEAASTMENAVTEIEVAKGNAVEVQENGEIKILQTAQDATQAGKDIAETSIDGTVKIEAGTTISAASAVPGVGAVAAEKGAEAIAGGTEQTVGSGLNIKDLLQGIGRISDNSQLLTTFQTTIGNALTGFDNAVGGWDNLINPVITSIGTLSGETGYKVQAETLQTYVAEDLTKIYIGAENNVNPAILAQDYTDTENVPTTQTIIGNVLQPTKENLIRTTTIQNSENTVNNTKKQGLKTPTFSFGI